MKSGATPFKAERVSREAWLAGATALVVFLVATLDLGTLALDPEQRVALSTGLASQESGLLGRRIALPALAFLGLAAIFLERKPTVGIKGVTGILLALALMWFCASVSWAIDPQLALRKVIVLICMWIGAIWAATWIRPRELPIVTLVSIAVVVAGCVVWEVTHGDFQVLSPQYRFGGFFHPNTAGRYLAIGVLALLVIYSTSAGLRRVWLFAPILLFGFLLFKTGSRTSALSLAAGIGSVTLLASIASRRARLWLLVWVVGSLGCLAAYALIGGDVMGVGSSALEMGRTGADLSTLTGRVPAWNVLISQFVSPRPLLGYGYNAFWTADHIVTMSFAVPGTAFFHAHSGYIDLVLSVGFVGAILYLSAILGALTVLVASFLRTRDPSLLFMIGMLVMLLSGMLTESINFNVSLPAFFTLVALSNAAFTKQYRYPRLARRVVCT